MLRQSSLCIVVFSLLAEPGCHVDHAEVTAVPLSPWNQGEPCGIPYYLPKPLLVVAKNVRHIDSAKVGLTAPAPIPNAFDNQASYGDIKANVSMPGNGTTAMAAATSTAAPNAPSAGANPTIAEAALQETVTPGRDFDRGLADDSFFTYQIVFVPDLSQKYGLRIKGGAGEIRAAMNLVNGWMFTGLGPYYLKDSSTAQNWMAAGVAAMYTGRGAADVTSSLADLAEKWPKKESGDLEAKDLRMMSEAIENLRTAAANRLVKDEMLDYAEIHVYQPELTPDGQMTWQLIAEHSFSRQFLRTEGGIPQEVLKELFQNMNRRTPPPAPTTAPGGATPSTGSPGGAAPAGTKESGDLSKLKSDIARSILGVPTLAPVANGSRKESGELTTGGGGGVTVQVNNGDETNIQRHGWGWPHHARKPTPQIKQTSVLGSSFSSAAATGPVTSYGNEVTKEATNPGGTSMTTIPPSVSSETTTMPPETPQLTSPQ